MRALEQLQTRRRNTQADDCTVIVVVFSTGAKTLATIDYKSH